MAPLRKSVFFFFNDTATTEIYTLSLHDALRSRRQKAQRFVDQFHLPKYLCQHHLKRDDPQHLLVLRSEEHTSELQSHSDLVCRLLLEKKKSPFSGTATRPLCQRDRGEKFVIAC